VDNARNDDWLHKSAAVLLLLTAVAKLYSASGSAKILEVQDRLLHLGYRPLMILAALLEIVVALFLLKSRSHLGRSLVLLWLSANFLAYHLANYLLGIHYCPCLGSLTDRLPLPRGLPDTLLIALVFWWFAGSVRSIWRLCASERWTRLTLAMRSALRKPSAAAH